MKGSKASGAGRDFMLVGNMGEVGKEVECSENEIPVVVQNASFFAGA